MATILILLRFGPRQQSLDDEDEEGDEDYEDDDDDEQDDHFGGDKDYAAIRSFSASERTSLRQHSTRKHSTRSIRQRPSLGGIV